MASATRSKHRQSRLSFQPVPASSPPQTQEGEGSVRQTRSSSKRSTQLPLTFESARVSRGHGLPTPTASSQALPAATKDPEIASDSSDDSQLSIMRFREQPEARQNATDMFKSITPRKSQVPVAPATPNSDLQKRSRPNPLFTSSKRMKSNSANDSSDSENDESESDVQIISSRRIRHGTQRPIVGDTNDDDGQIDGLDGLQSSSPGPSFRTRSKQTPIPIHAPGKANGTVSDDESDEEPITPRRKLGEAPRAQQISSDSEEGAAATPSDDNVVEVPVTSTKARKRDHEVLEDANDLEDTEVRDTRTRGKVLVEKSARQKQLEILRARRAGKKVAAPSSKSSSEAEERNDIERILHPPSRSREPENEGGDDNDWIIQDEDEEWRNEMPLKYSAQAHMHAKDYFKHVVEWMVHKKLNPAFDRNDEIYVMAFQKIDDEAKGFAGSKFSSSIWRPLFLRALKARPDFNDVEDDSPVLPVGCEACGHTTHPARWRVTFGGKAYHPNTLEPLKEDDDDDGEEEEGDDGDNESVDADGNAIPDEHFEFKVGRHCKSNAFIAHSLLHWRWHLNQWVLGWLEAQQYLTPERLVERDSWSTKKRKAFANKVVDAMDSDGEIKALRRDFKSRLDEARSRKAAAFGRADEVGR